ncbi:uncharacterized protein LOC131996044 [Stomoxys calcitrans]|uniref:uncharacterized protein LOC131996044 n=1 Tax=Stomoxys calcitrans TaxID=35570 RepID=UPI0027E35766|nr:uncharacterized protein LOC131996044 [Stomoxys calcitrans]
MGNKLLLTYSRLQFSICLLSLLVENVHNKGNYLIQFTKCSCSHKTPRVRAFECSLRNDSKRLNLIDIRAELSAVIQEVNARAILHLFQKNRPRMTLVDVTVNACNFMETMSKVRMFVIFRRVLDKYLNVIPKCPLKKDFNYTLTGMHYGVDDLPPYLPEADFKNIILLTTKRNETVKMEFFGRILKI